MPILAAYTEWYSCLKIHKYFYNYTGYMTKLYPLISLISYSHFPYQNPFSPFSSALSSEKENAKRKPKTAAVQPPNNSVLTSIKFPAGTELVEVTWFVKDVVSMISYSISSKHGGIAPSFRNIPFLYAMISILSRLGCQFLNLSV